MDSARCTDPGRSLELMDLVSELFMWTQFSDILYRALVHSRLVGVHGKTSVGHFEQRVLFELQYLECAGSHD